MYIETDRLIIRPFEEGDAQDLYLILGDGAAMKHLEAAYSFEKTEAFLKSFCIGKAGAVAAVHAQDQKVIGYILFSEIKTGYFEMGWVFNRNYWRRGYAFEACGAIMDYAFEVIGADEIFAETTDGVKSVGLMRKLGMKETESPMPDAEDPADMFHYSIRAADRRRG